MTFYSIPGSNYSGERSRALPRHPGAEEFYKNRSETSHQRSGFSEGDPILIRGEHAVVEHEERDVHTGEVTTWVHTNDAGGSGNYMVKWVPDRARSMAIREVRKTRD